MLTIVLELLEGKKSTFDKGVFKTEMSRPSKVQRSQACNFRKYEMFLKISRQIGLDIQRKVLMS